MERAFPAANILPRPALVSVVRGMCRTAAQRGDAHVVAAAVTAKATVIVTHNIKDFAPQVLDRYGLSKARPDTFCMGLLASHQAQVLAGVRAHRASLKRIPMTPVQYVGHLADGRLGMPRLAHALALHLHSV